MRCNHSDSLVFHRTCLCVAHSLFDELARQAALSTNHPMDGNVFGSWTSSRVHVVVLELLW